MHVVWHMGHPDGGLGSISLLRATALQMRMCARDVLEL